MLNAQIDNIELWLGCLSAGDGLQIFRRLNQRASDGDDLALNRLGWRWRKTAAAYRSTLDNASPTAIHLYKLVPVSCNLHTRKLDNDITNK